MYKIALANMQSLVLNLLFANLVAEYIDEGDEEDDSALDKGGIMAAISDVSNKVPIT